MQALLITLAVSIPCPWAAYQLNWVHERDAFMDKYHARANHMSTIDEFPDMPWELRLFGARYEHGLDIPESQVNRAHDLFPEAILYLYPDADKPK